MKHFVSYQLALELYRSLNLAKAKGPIRDQLDRAALSVVLNLAEGSGKDGKDRVRFFKIAYGSMRETQACLEILNWKPEAAKADKLGAHIYKLFPKSRKVAGHLTGLPGCPVRLPSALSLSLSLSLFYPRTSSAPR